MRQNISRRKLLQAGTASLAAPALWRSSASAGVTHPVLVELFTSQGCSSCPPADKLAARLIDDPNITLLSFSVDYWDYLGWRDTLAKPEYSQRQYDYARSRGDAQVYTPQMVINGVSHAVGSQRDAVMEQVNAAKPLIIPVNLSLTTKDIHVELAPHDLGGEATLWLMAVAPRLTQTMDRGENAGTTITYSNVVRNMVPAAMWRGEAFSASWMTSAVMTPDASACVAVLQRDKTGAVLGVARI